MIRKVKKDEIPRLYPFVLKILKDMELSILETIEEDVFEKIVVDAMYSPQYRYGYENAYVYMVEEEIAGVLFGYPGRLEPLIDGPLQASFLKHGFSYKKISQENETLPGEWYLDTLVIDPNFRRQGIASALIQHAAEVAKELGYERMGLNCETDNVPAYNLYQKLGFQSVTQLVISHHVYWHMIKTL
jgi:GNAT superfamily N-acetyltransferase